MKNIRKIKEPKRSKTVDKNGVRENLVNKWSKRSPQKKKKRQKLGIGRLGVIGCQPILHGS